MLAASSLVAFSAFVFSAFQRTEKAVSPPAILSTLVPVDVTSLP